MPCKRKGTSTLQEGGSRPNHTGSGRVAYTLSGTSWGSYRARNQKSKTAAPRGRSLRSALPWRIFFRDEFGKHVGVLRWVGGSVRHDSQPRGYPEASYQ